MKPQHLRMYMGVAEVIGSASLSKKRKVGAIAVSGDIIIGDGYNGTPSGFHTNSPEYVRAMYALDDYKLETRPEVIHAEMNMLAKITRSNNSSFGCTVFCTHAPCLNCAIHLNQAGIETLYYNREYKTSEGKDFLNKIGVEVCNLKM